MPIRWPGYRTGDAGRRVVVTHAEVLAQTTIAQLTRPGTPLVYGMSSSVPDMRGGINLSGAVEIGLLGAAVARLAKRCGLPCVMSTGSDAHAPGAQSVMERLMTLFVTALAGIDLVKLTTLENKCPSAWSSWWWTRRCSVWSNDACRGIAVDDSTLALDLIHDVGLGGAFITTDHTLGHFRDELLVPDLITARIENRGRQRVRLICVPSPKRRSVSWRSISLYRWPATLSHNWMKSSRKQSLEDRAMDSPRRDGWKR